MKEFAMKNHLNQLIYNIMKRKILFGILCASMVCCSGWFIFERYGAHNELTAANIALDEQEATIRAIKKVTPSVVSIVVTGYERSLVIDYATGKTYEQNEKKDLGSGTGFIISSDGLIITNKHVVNMGNKDSNEYRVILSGGKKYYAQLIGLDPLKDLAILKIFDKNLPVAEIGDSDKLQVGTTVITIGNSLGKYPQSVTKGIVSGLGRDIVASDMKGAPETLDNVLQTDAEINFGNSGGPLIDLEGKVIGINVAIDQGGSAIGFAIPINDAKPVITSIKQIGRIIRPRLGVSYMMINPEMAWEKKLAKDFGALIIAKEEGGEAVVKDSPADKAGLKNNDIIFEVNNTKLDEKNTLLGIVQKFKPKDKITCKIQRGSEVITKIVELDEFR